MPLLKLPPEIRNTIYEYVLGGHKLYYVAYGDKMSLRHNPPDPKSEFAEIPQFLALTKTCRQIQAETKLLPFKLNVFGGVATDHLRFLARIGPRAAKAIKTIHIDASYRSGLSDSLSRLFYLLPGLQGLRKTAVTVYVGSRHSQRKERFLRKLKMELMELKEISSECGRNIEVVLDYMQ